MEDVLWFEQLDRGSLKEAGGKGANLGEMAKHGFPVPPGFVTTSGAYYKHLDYNNLRERMSQVLDSLDVDDTAALDRAAKHLQAMVVDGEMPPEVEKVIRKNYKKLCEMRGETVYVAVRSSATAEDLPTASFAGQQSTYLNVHGEDDVIKAVKDCWASLFTPRAIFYRVQNKFEHMKVGLAAVVQEMVQSEKAGVMFTVDPISEDMEVIMIEAAYGLGEVVVSGSVTPDTYRVNKKSMKILTKDIAKQDWMLVKHGEKNVKAEIKEDAQGKQKLTDEQIIGFAKLGKRIEEHYKFPQDIEWAVQKDELFIVQSRPITTLKTGKLGEGKKKMAITPIHEGAVPPESFAMAPPATGEIPPAPSAASGAMNILLRGLGASPGIGVGKVNMIPTPEDIPRMEERAVLVTDMTTPDFVPAMKKAAAIVTNTGGMTSHAAIVSRELGIPCIVGSKNATELLKGGQIVTVDGTHGMVYEGKVELLRAEAAPVAAEGGAPAAEAAPVCGTRIYMNIADPDAAEKYAYLPADGVGLMRAEFIIAAIGEHPKKMMAEGRGQEYIDKLAEEIRRIAAAFYPRPVVYRATDFKTNEYRNLKGGEQYEPHEENPMMGYRGASRYIAEPDVFKMELRALQKARDEFGMKNVWLMIPFVRRIGELRAIKDIMGSIGFYRTRDFRLWIMVEVPSTVFLIEDFCKEGIDGISIGSNDLTQLILGIDRDNGTLASAFDERNEAVLRAVRQVVETTAKYGVSSSLCGQAPSVYPDFAEKLVEYGITSMSVNPDAVLRTRRIVASAEQKIMLKRLRELSNGKKEGESSPVQDTRNWQM
ncbi:MAG: phosphoenolpyruvate synthase [Candidatus ainarchaeum sp.]|nr:phosphoenolpyruvate synthase [Candidatus ainarchaeum sp.]MDD5096349.1 phosphoenolpyruvate synthase [Candidatus ainarchaeum sp.]